MPLYKLAHQPLDQPIPPGRYLLDEGPDLPRFTLQVDREITPEKFREALLEKFGNESERAAR